MADWQKGEESSPYRQSRNCLVNPCTYYPWAFLLPEIINLLISGQLLVGFLLQQIEVLKMYFLDEK